MTALYRVYGIRHHGPGSARALAAALTAQRPDLVLIEGPPEADPLVPLAADPEMTPPVALLGYVPRSGADSDDHRPGTASFWPFAVFSPEWQAIRYAAAAGIPARFCDLPAGHQLALRDSDSKGGAPDEREPGRPAGPAEPESLATRVDPIGRLAAAAGYDDPERWWEDVVEHAPSVRAQPAVFDAVAEAMAALRARAALDPSDARREAHMRKTVRAALKDGYTNIAVVCGAWHVPALRTLSGAGADTALLRGLPRVKVTLTWVPWTYGRLASWSGYGAGVRAPGWYDHLFTASDRPIERWLARAATALREEGLAASAAHVIESVRLAEALAALRGRPLAGLDEVTEATRAVLCEGNDLLVELIGRQLVVGERLGAVPAATPMMPLQRDLTDQQRARRLKPDASAKDIDLDLRKPLDLGRSGLLHRLALLDIDWGRAPQTHRARNLGTFRESWQVRWRPELDLAVIEAGRWGNTVAEAATARATAAAETAGTLAELTALTEKCLLADLGAALPGVLAALRARAALDADVTHLMAALPALLRAARYGDVRGTDPARLTTVGTDLLTRICTGLPGAVTALDDAAERDMRDRIDAVHSATALLAEPDSRVRWLDTLARLADRAPALIAGRVHRLLLEAGRLGAADAALRLTRELSAGVPAATAASWIEGFLAGSGVLLVHDTTLLGLVDGWLAGLAADSFQAVLPALRRTFGSFAQPERRAIGERAARLAPRTGDRRDPAADLDPAATGYDPGRAAGAIATVAGILGLRTPTTEAA
jgi:hypothetical protein